MGKEKQRYIDLQNIVKDAVIEKRYWDDKRRDWDIETVTLDDLINVLSGSYTDEQPIMEQARHSGKWLRASPFSEFRIINCCEECGKTDCEYVREGQSNLCCKNEYGSEELSKYCGDCGLDYASDIHDAVKGEREKKL